MDFIIKIDVKKRDVSYPETFFREYHQTFCWNESHCTKQQVCDEHDAPIRVVLPFKDQKAANAVRHHLGDLSRKIVADVQPIYTSQEIKDDYSRKNTKTSNC